MSAHLSRHPQSSECTHAAASLPHTRQGGCHSPLRAPRTHGRQARAVPPHLSPLPPPPQRRPAKFAKTPQGAIARPAGAADVTPPAPPSVSAQTKGLVPFMFLNPYDSDMRCKAKLSKKVRARAACGLVLEGREARSAATTPRQDVHQGCGQGIEQEASSRARRRERPHNQHWGRVLSLVACCLTILLLSMSPYCAVPYPAAEQQQEDDGRVH